jgi:hypothetical protein
MINAIMAKAIFEGMMMVEGFKPIESSHEEFERLLLHEEAQDHLEIFKPALEKIAEFNGLQYIEPILSDEGANLLVESPMLFLKEYGQRLRRIVASAQGELVYI